MKGSIRCGGRSRIGISLEHLDGLVDLPVALVDIEKPLLVLLPLESFPAAVN
jgi:hypothetical protein